jgi:hypothetical protein
MKTGIKCLHRPKRIFIRYVDPFDDCLVASAQYHYDARLSARSFYSRSARRMQNALRSIQCHILQGRTPEIKVSLEYYQPSIAPTLRVSR